MPALKQRTGNWRACFFILGLYLFALGTGGIKPNIPAFGADQFDSADPVERVTKGSFFNWYYFSVNMGSLLSATVFVWVQDNIGWFFEKAAILSEENLSAQSSPWRLCTVPQVEEVKMLVRMLPVWASFLIFFMVTAQMSSTLIEQGVAMDGHVGSFTMPPASLATFNIISVLIWVPIYDVVLVPLACRVTGKERGISHLQRIGVGLMLSVVAMVYSALVEA
uniref:Uncharacterized protein n=1 Tax=Leersia perrieri TaxID=77586 RepID=A0A0D9XH89_9ORYZ